MTMDYFILDIETLPLDIDAYSSLDEEEQKKLINPIDSRTLAIGIRHEGRDQIIMKEDEKEMLEEFWREWKKLHEKNIKVVGFNINNFDIPFLVTRSFIHDVVISPFNLKSIIDLRDKVSAYRHGHSRGTLKDFAAAIGFTDLGLDGSDIAQFFRENNIERIREYLNNDLAITDAMYQRMQKTNILYINKW